MSETWFEYGEITSESLFDILPKEEQEILNSFKKYICISASDERSKEAVREVLRFRKITGTTLNKIGLEDLRHFLLQIKKSGFGEHTKNKIKGFVHRFLRWKYKDWSIRFNEFEDLKLNGDAQNKKLINEDSLLTWEEIERLLKEEKSLFWKTFLIVQAEGGLRTKEVRELLWKNISYDDDGFSTLNISSKKNRNGTAKIEPVWVFESTNFLKELLVTPACLKEVIS